MLTSFDPNLTGHLISGVEIPGLVLPNQPNQFWIVHHQNQTYLVVANQTNVRSNCTDALLTDFSPNLVSASCLFEPCADASRFSMFFDWFDGFFHGNCLGDGKCHSTQHPPTGHIVKYWRK